MLAEGASRSIAVRDSEQSEGSCRRLQTTRTTVRGLATARCLLDGAAMSNNEPRGADAAVAGDVRDGGLRSSLHAAATDLSGRCDATELGPTLAGSAIMIKPLVVVLVLCSFTASVRAEPRTHDGFYARIGVGPSFAIAKLFSATDSDSTGLAVSTELSVGTTIRPRLVLGVGTFPMVSPAPDYDGIDAGGQHVSATGPFVDYYFSSSGGLHVQGGLLLTVGYLDGSDDRAGNVGMGYGGMVGVGYDRYVSDHWSLGGSVRLTAYRLYGVDDSIRIATPAALLTLTYH